MVGEACLALVNFADSIKYRSRFWREKGVFLAFFGVVRPEWVGEEFLDLGDKMMLDILQKRDASRLVKRLMF